jgi:diguanylate cyclase (GGDEF)-like protein
MPYVHTKTKNWKLKNDYYKWPHLIRQTMDNIETIIERLKENEEIDKKFYQVETKILKVLNFKDFFEVLLTEIKDIFNVPYVWISLIKTSEVISLLRQMESSKILKKNINIIDRAPFQKLVDDNKTPLLVNKDLKPFYELIPIKRKHLIGSIAIAPISIDGEIIGSLNQADSSPIRFQPGMDTALLEHLAVKISLCLSNVTAHEKLKIMAYHDPLTGLLNRRVMHSAIKREFKRSKRYGSPLSVAFFDIDNLKRINDTHGHDSGDAMIKHVADILSYESRESDIITRFAGDEFVAIFPETNENDAKNLINRIKLYCLEHPLNTEKLSIPVSISFGVSSTANKEIKSPDLLLKHADEALYKAKRIKSKGLGKKSNIINLPVNRKNSGKKN